MTAEFKRETPRTFVVAPGFAVVVALCATGANLKKHYAAERAKGKIVLVVAENLSADLNADSIALADEFLVVLEDKKGQYTDFEAAMFITAEKLQKSIREIIAAEEK